MRVAVLVLLLAVPSVHADEKAKAKAKAQAAIALALAEMDESPSTQPEWTPYKDAYAKGISENKVVVVHVAGFDCGNVCEVDETIIRTKSTMLYDDSTPRMVMFAPSGNGQMTMLKEWKTAPCSNEVKKIIQDAKRNSLKDKPASQPKLEWGISTPIQNIQYVASTPQPMQYYSPMQSYRPQSYSGYGYGNFGGYSGGAAQCVGGG